MLRRPLTDLGNEQRSLGRPCAPSAQQPQRLAMGQPQKGLVTRQLQARSCPSWCCRLGGQVARWSLRPSWPSRQHSCRCSGRGRSLPTRLGLPVGRITSNAMRRVRQLRSNHSCKQVTHFSASHRAAQRLEKPQRLRRWQRKALGRVVQVGSGTSERVDRARNCLSCLQMPLYARLR